jgi:hypothetical protein
MCKQNNSFNDDGQKQNNLTSTNIFCLWGTLHAQRVLFKMYRKCQRSRNTYIGIRYRWKVLLTFCAELLVLRCLRQSNHCSTRPAQTNNQSNVPIGIKCVSDRSKQKQWTTSCFLMFARKWTTMQSVISHIDLPTPPPPPPTGGLGRGYRACLFIPRNA